MLARIETKLRSIRRLFRRTDMVARLFKLDRVLSAKASLPSESGHTSAYRTGLIIVQIDGLGYSEFKKALRGGETPFMQSLLTSEHYALNHLYSGLPSSTPSVQGELFYGVKTVVPAFAFIDQQTDSVYRMYEPRSALAIERELMIRGNDPLLSGGSAYCNIYTGGASESHFCTASLGWNDVLSGVRPIVWLGIFILYLPLIIRLLLLVILEFLLSIVDMVRGWISGYDVKAEFKFVIARVAISVLMRDMITIGARLDIARGLPIIHLNYLGYDEQAHRRGPGSAFAHITLKGIDERIRSLWAAAHQSQGRHYDLWIYSDHGQEATLQYENLTGFNIVDAVRMAIESLQPDADIRVQSLNERINQRRTNLFGGTLFKRLFPKPGLVEDASDTTGISVVAMGPVGHIYLDSETLKLFSLNELANYLVDKSQIPGVLYVHDECVVARCSNGLLHLPDDGRSLLGASHFALTEAIDDLIALVRHPQAGQLILLGWVAGSKPLSFPRENGAHAGIGPFETEAFSLLPEEHCSAIDATSAMRPLHLRRRALDLLRERSTTATRLYHQHRSMRKPGTLRVISYNVHSCVGMDSRIAPERIARILSRYQPDVIALQELDIAKSRTDGINQANLIAQALEMDHKFHPAMQAEGEAYGDAILTYLPVVACRSEILPSVEQRSDLEPRGVLWLSIAVDGVEIQVLNTHLGLNAAEQLIQAKELTSDRWLNHPACSGPTILCGDMNATPRSVTMKQLAKHMVESQTLSPDNVRKNTFPGRVPSLCIDHILVREIKSISNVQVPSTELTRLASDHLPLLVDIEFTVPD